MKKLESNTTITQKSYSEKEAFWYKNINSGEIHPIYCADCEYFNISPFFNAYIKVEPWKFFGSDKVIFLKKKFLSR